MEKYEHDRAGHSCRVMRLALAVGLLVGANCNSRAPQTEESSCMDVAEDNGVEITMNATSGAGRQLSYSRRVTTTKDGNLLIETEVTADGQLVMQATTTGLEGRTIVEVEYGPLVPGLVSGRAVAENGMVEGSVDGRSIVPMSIDDAAEESLRFQDGNPPPDLGMDPDIEDAVRELMSAADSAAQGCNEVQFDEQRGATGVVRAAHGSDFGHDSNPVATIECGACWGGCSAATAGCVAGATVGCGFTLFCFPKCEAAAVALCAGGYVACVKACNSSGAPCCPVSCGEVACCDSGETCLNAQIGLCCSEGKTACAGEQCCGSTEVCIDSGPNAGTCCEPENLCGESCCADGDSCIAEESICCSSDTIPCVDKCCDTDGCIEDGPEAGTCCESGNICGNTCCDELDSCIESLSLCCGFNEPACGNACCQFGESCLGGNTCCPNDRVCNGICCPEGTGCDQTTDTCVACSSPTQKVCPETGTCCPVTEVCSPIPDLCCAAGEIYCNGACRPFSECIN